MKAQSIKNNDREDRLAITKSATTSNWPLLPGLLLSDLGLLSIAFAGWDALSARAHTLFYSSGAILCLVGLVFIWIGTTGIAAVVQKHARTDFRAGKLALPEEENNGRLLINFGTIG